MLNWNFWRCLEGGRGGGQAKKSSVWGYGYFLEQHIVPKFYHQINCVKCLERLMIHDLYQRIKTDSADLSFSKYYLLFALCFFFTQVTEFILLGSVQVMSTARILKFYFRKVMQVNSCSTPYQSFHQSDSSYQLRIQMRQVGSLKQAGKQAGGQADSHIHMYQVLMSLQVIRSA